MIYHSNPGNHFFLLVCLSLIVSLFSELARQGQAISLYCDHVSHLPHGADVCVHSLSSLALQCLSLALTFKLPIKLWADLTEYHTEVLIPSNCKLDWNALLSETYHFTCYISF